MADVTWGVCATIKASTDEILRFTAHHLDAGAHRVWVFLDAPNDQAHDALKTHPKCRVTVCDDAYWRQAFGRRPEKHQVRQSWNATRAFARAQDVTWVLHADVDEFIVSERRVDDVLATMSSDIRTVRVRPTEALASSTPTITPCAFKAFIPPGPERQNTVRLLYPQYGAFLKGGFLSHVAGKLFVRAGLQDLTFRIHNVFQNDHMNPCSTETDHLHLAHLHAPDWPTWRAHLDYRLQKGAYRAELSPMPAENLGGETLHSVLADLQATRGDSGVREFFDEVAMDSIVLRARLQHHGLLRLHNLDLSAKQMAHFPAYRDKRPTV